MRSRAIGMEAQNFALCRWTLIIPKCTAIPPALWASTGYYWTSTASSADSAHYIDFTSSSISMTGHSGSRGQGQALRCVARWGVKFASLVSAQANAGEHTQPYQAGLANPASETPI